MVIFSKIGRAEGCSANLGVVAPVVAEVAGAAAGAVVAAVVAGAVVVVAGAVGNSTGAVVAAAVGAGIAESWTAGPVDSTVVVDRTVAAPVGIVVDIEG